MQIQLMKEVKLGGVIILNKGTVHDAEVVENESYYIVKDKCGYPIKIYRTECTVV